MKNASFRDFINEHLLAWCQDRPTGTPVQFTRSRPYTKDDNAHGEQKNWTHVRKLVGWERSDTPTALTALNALYTDLRLFQNLFQPSMKLVRKVRVGSRLIRRYDQPRTPFERVQTCGPADPTRLAALQRVLTTTDPFALSRRIDQHLERLWALATRVTRTPREAAPRPPRPRASTPLAWLDLQPPGPQPDACEYQFSRISRGDMSARPIERSPRISQM